MNTALFIERPRRLEDLQVLHPMEAEQPFEIMAVVNLRAIDYKNFTTDMLADRWFIEKYAHLCGKTDTVWKCILVKKHGSRDGVLVLPRDVSHVGWAAYYAADEIDKRALTMAELKALLLEEIDSEGDVNMDRIDTILDALRYDPDYKEPDVDAAWEDFVQNYLPFAISDGLGNNP